MFGYVILNNIASTHFGLSEFLSRPSPTGFEFVGSIRAGFKKAKFWPEETWIRTFLYGITFRPIKIYRIVQVFLRTGFFVGSIRTRL